MPLLYFSSSHSRSSALKLWTRHKCSSLATLLAAGPRAMRVCKNRAPASDTLVQSRQKQNKNRQQTLHNIVDCPERGKGAHLDSKGRPLSSPLPIHSGIHDPPQPPRPDAPPPDLQAHGGLVLRHDLVHDLVVELVRARGPHLRLQPPDRHQLHHRPGHRLDLLRRPRRLDRRRDHPAQSLHRPSPRASAPIAALRSLPARRFPRPPATAHP
eukprot:3180330-Rhodomonas_salina.4